MNIRATNWQNRTCYRADKSCKLDLEPGQTRSAHWRGMLELLQTLMQHRLWAPVSRLARYLESKSQGHRADPWCHPRMPRWKRQPEAPLKEGPIACNPHSLGWARLATRRLLNVMPNQACSLTLLEIRGKKMARRRHHAG